MVEGSQRFVEAMVADPVGDVLQRLPRSFTFRECGRMRRWRLLVFLWIGYIFLRRQENGNFSSNLEPVTQKELEKQTMKQRRYIRRT